MYTYWHTFLRFISLFSVTKHDKLLVITGHRKNKKRAKEVSVHQFLVLYRDFNIWPAEVTKT